MTIEILVKFMFRDTLMKLLDSERLEYRTLTA